MLIIGVMTTLGCSAKEPFLKQEVQEVSATVEAIDPENRLMSLRGPAGTATILAGPDIVNFPQIHVGDKVKVTVHRRRRGEHHQEQGRRRPRRSTPQALYGAQGSKPAAAVGATITTTVQIESVDTSFETVTFKRPDGFVRTIAPASPEGKKFIRTLKKGDMVDVSYTEALAISVEPAS